MLTPVMLFTSSFAIAQAPDADLSRVRTLLEETREMSTEERKIYLRALLNAGKEPSHVQSSLFLAFELNNAGAEFDEILTQATAHERTVDTDPVVLPAPRPTITDEELDAIRIYQRRQLTIRDELNISGGGTSYYPGNLGVGGMVLSDPIVSTRTWTVYQGSVRLDIPSFYDVTHRPDEAKALRDKIRQKRALSWTFYGVGVAGSVAMLGGWIASPTAQSQEEFNRYQSVIAVGFVASLVGMIGGSFPANKAQKLKNNFPKNFDIQEIQDDIDHYNEQLRKELGVSPEAALHSERRP